MPVGIANFNRRKGLGSYTGFVLNNFPDQATAFDLEGNVVERGICRQEAETLPLRPYCTQCPSAPQLQVRKKILFVGLWESMVQKDISGRGGSRGTGAQQQIATYRLSISKSFAPLVVSHE